MKQAQTPTITHTLEWVQFDLPKYQKDVLDTLQITVTKTLSDEAIQTLLAIIEQEKDHMAEITKMDVQNWLSNWTAIAFLHGEQLAGFVKGAPLDKVWNKLSTENQPTAETIFEIGSLAIAPQLRWRHFAKHLLFIIINKLQQYPWFLITNVAKVKQSMDHLWFNSFVVQELEPLVADEFKSDWKILVFEGIAELLPNDVIYMNTNMFNLLTQGTNA